MTSEQGYETPLPAWKQPIYRRIYQGQGLLDGMHDHYNRIGL
jgi:hypothetical protein